MRKKPVKSTSVGSDLKRRIVKKQQGSVASYINVNEPVLQYKNDNWIELPDAFSEYNLPTKIKPHNEEPLPVAIKAVDTKEERAKADSERKPVKQNAFINGLRPIIEQTLKRRGLDTKWTDHLVAQAALESGWGKSESGKFNLSGIKGKGSEKNTKEYINGKMVNTRDSFRDYKDYNDWADNYINLLSNKRYGKAWTLSEDQFMPYIINAGYATDPNYISKYNKVLAEVKKYEDGGRIRRFQNGKPIKKYYGKPLSEGMIEVARGWQDVEDIPERTRMFTYNKYNPSGTGGTEVLARDNLGRKTRPDNLIGTPEEEAYWALYLGLPQDLIKPTKARHPKGEPDKYKDAEFVGTPREMDLRIQGVADTLNTGILSRMSKEQYEALRKKQPLLPEQDKMKKTYAFGKEMLDNPGKVMQASETLSPMRQYNPNGDMYSGLGAFGGEGTFIDNGGFGMMWNNKTNTVHSWDHYNFPLYQRWWANIPDRKKPLEIRSEVKLDPKKGSIILNELLKQTK